MAWWKRGGVLQMDQLGLLEYGGDRLCTLHADGVAAEPAKWPKGGMSEVVTGG